MTSEHAWRLQLARKQEWWLFWIVAVLVLGAGLGLRDPWPADEPRFALVARQMVESGQWLFPMRGNEYYPDKPPLLMWLQAASYLLVRDWRVAFLLPSLLSALGTLALVRDLGRRLWSREAGAAAAWALLFALQFTFQARRAQIDPLLVFCVTLSLYGLLRHLLRGPAIGWWWLGWAAAGLGVIAKGVGIIALLVLIPATVALWRNWPGIRAPRWHHWPTGVLAFLLPILAWGVPMLLTVQASGDPALQAYANNILFKQTGQRYAAAWHHHQPWWYFGGVILSQWLPAVLALPWVLPRWRDALRARDVRVWLPLGWLVLMLLFFGLSSGKREVYILPGLPVFCLLLGPWLAEVLPRRWPRRLLRGFSLLMGGALLLTGAAIVFGDPAFERKLAVDRGLDAATVQAAGGVLLAIGLWAAASALAFWRWPARMAVSTLTGLWLLVGLALSPLLNDSSSGRDVMREAGRIIGPQAELGLVAWKEQNMLMADRPAATFGFMQPAAEQLQRGLAWQRHSPNTRWLLMESDALGTCIDPDRARRVGQSNRRIWYLVPAAAVRADCDPLADGPSP